MSELVAAADPAAFERAATELRAGRLVGIPTETVYGLAALPDERSVEALIAAKRRSSDKGIQLLIDSLDQARTVAVLSPAAEQLAEAFWPGGLTIVVERRPEAGLPLLLGGGRTTLGLRLPDHVVPRTLARMLGPLAASSANVTGYPPALDAWTIIESLGAEVGLILDDGPVRGGVASTVVDCTGAAPLVLREGAIRASEIFRALGQDYTSR